jgi:hypothetical protein
MARIAVPGPALAATDALLRPVLAVLAAAALLELLVLRTFTRTAMHIPDIQALETPYLGVTGLGRYAYFVAATSLVASLLLLALAIPARRDARSWAAGLGVGVFIIAATLARLGEGPQAITIALSLSAVATTGAAAAAHSARLAAFIVPVTAAFALGAGYAIGQSLGAGGLGWLHTAMEIPAVAAALAAPFAFSVPLKGRNLAVAIGTAAVVFLFFAGNPATSRILLLWNAGLSGALPGVVYALAAGVAAGTVAGVVRSGRWQAGIALTLVVAAGVGVESTYQTGLLVCALLLLALPAFRAGGETDAPRPPAKQPSQDLTATRSPAPSANPS